jgi:hypothetical protein
LQLFAGQLLQRVQLFAARLMLLLQLFAAGRAGPRCLVAAERCLVRGPRAWCRWLPSAAWWPPAALVAQLLPVAAWSRSCCLAVFVFVIRAGPCL